MLLFELPSPIERCDTYRVHHFSGIPFFCAVDHSHRRSAPWDLAVCSRQGEHRKLELVTAQCSTAHFVSIRNDAIVYSRFDSI